MKNGLKTAVLLVVLGLLFLFIGEAIGGRSGLQIAFVFALALNFFSYWFSDKMVLAMYHARKVSESESPELHSIVDRLAANAGIPKPAVYIIPTSTPNAFATGRNPKHAAVAATEGILGILSADELEGVLAHELAHVKNRDILIGTIAATMAMAITYLARMAQYVAIFGGMDRDRDNDSGGIFAILAMAILSPIAALLIQMAISRSREFQADRSGAFISKKPASLANALLKLEQGVARMPLQEGSPATAHLFIVNPFRGEGFARLFSTHPSTNERVQRLQEIANSDSFKYGLH